LTFILPPSFPFRLSPFSPPPLPYINPPLFSLTHSLLPLSLSPFSLLLYIKEEEGGRRESEGQN